MKRFLFLLITFISFNSYSASWKSVSDEWELDTSSIHKSWNGNVKFWIKEESSQEKIAIVKKSLQKIGENKNFSKYSYSLVMYELNCKERRIGVASGIFYDKDEQIIYRFENEYPTMESIVPNTQGENIIQYVCKK